MGIDNADRHKAELMIRIKMSVWCMFIEKKAIIGLKECGLKERLRVG